MSKKTERKLAKTSYDGQKLRLGWGDLSAEEKLKKVLALSC